MQCSRIVIHGSELGISESTLRRIINDCDIEARNGDLRTAVKMKPRRKKRSTGYKTMHFQIAIIMDYHTSECVVKALDKGVLRTLCSRRTTEWKMRGFAAE